MNSPNSDAVVPPRHVAVIMDGNGRWATARHLPRAAGHSRGVEAVPADEVSLLMRLFVSSLQREVGRLVENGVRMRVVGQVDSLEPELRRLIRDAEDRTEGNERLNLTVCASYGGRWDIVQAARALAKRAAREGNLSAIDEQRFAAELAPAFAPDPDLLIRTGGERRISNFLLWQMAYTELYFTDVLWPDFDADQLEIAFGWFARRERRFGRVESTLSRP